MFKHELKGVICFTIFNTSIKIAYKNMSYIEYILGRSLATVLCSSRSHPDGLQSPYFDTNFLSTEPCDKDLSTIVLT